MWLTGGKSVQEVRVLIELTSHPLNYHSVGVNTSCLVLQLNWEFADDIHDSNLPMHILI